MEPAAAESGLGVVDRGANRRASFATHLRFLLDALREQQLGGGGPARAGAGAGAGAAPPTVLFVLEEFDAFARRPKQTLLYTLFDLSHKAGSHIAVCGLTTRLDAVGLLDKRVKSRFDNRQLLCATPDLGTVLDILRRRLKFGERQHQLRAEWDAHVERVLAAPAVRSELGVHHMLGRDVGWFLRVFHVASCAVFRTDRDASRPFLDEADVLGAVALMTADARSSLVRALARCELTLLLVALYLERVTGMPAYSFECVFQYQPTLQAYGESTRAEPEWTRVVACKAFEHLVALGLLAPAPDRAFKSGPLAKMGEGGALRAPVPREFRLYRCALQDPNASLLRQLATSHASHYLCRAARKLQGLG